MALNIRSTPNDGDNMKIKLFGGPWDGDIAEVDTNDGFDPPRTYQIECVLREPGGLSVKKGATRLPLGA